MNRIHRFFINMCLAGLATASAVAQSPTQLAVPNSPAYEQAAERLRMAPPRQYDFAKAMMADVMRLMAEDAGISFFGLPEGATGSERLVTFSINASPFTALETLSKANGISLIVENGIWYIRPADDTELVGRIYQINYNAQELVTKNGQGGSTGGSGGGSSGGGTGSSIGLDLQGAPDFFVTEPSRLLEDVRGILDLQTTGRNATFAPTGSVDTLGQLALGGLQAQPDVFVRTGQNGRQPDTASDVANQAKVIWNSDSNSLYVVATRQQHQWVEGYLAAADQPQPLVAVEVKILEINKDPQNELGIDWTGTLAGGWGASLEGLDGSISSPINLDRVGDYALPTAILSYDDVNLRLRALFDDRRNRAVSYPRMITLDNREVNFRSVINQPVLSSSASTSLGAGATETNSVEYVPIGTVINILPKRMSDGKVLLNVSITISAIIGTEIINGNPFPIASSRVYTAPVTVDSGYTVAISGLDQAEEDRTDQGIPLLGKIPILGYAFKYRGESRSRQHLMMLITPTLLNPQAPGVPERPTIRNPWGNTLPSFEPFGDDQLPPEEQERSDRRDRQPETNAPAPMVPPLMGPSNPQNYRTADAGATAPSAGANPMALAAAPVAMPAVVETPAPAMPVATVETKERKGPFAKFFGRNKKPKTIETGPVGGGFQESAPEPAGIPAWEDSPLPALAESKPRRSTRDPGFFGVGRDAAIEPIPVPAPELITHTNPVPAAPRVAQSKPAPARASENRKSSGGIRWDGTELVGGTQAVPGAVTQLENELKAAGNQGDTDAVNQIRSQTSRLIDYVNHLREEGSVPVNGELSDEWWTLIKLKTQANAMSRSNAPTLVDTAVEP